MAYIEIKSWENADGVLTAPCSEYFFESADAHNRGRCSIKPGEVAIVPDDEIEKHLKTGIVAEITERSAIGKRIVNAEDQAPKTRGRPRKSTEPDAPEA